MDPYAAAAGVATAPPPRRGAMPPPGAGIVTPDQQMPDTTAGSPIDLAEVERAYANAPNTPAAQAAKADLLRFAATQQPTQGAQQPRAAAPDPYAAAAGLVPGATPASAPSPTAAAAPAPSSSTLDNAIRGVVASSPYGPAGEAALSAVTGMGASAVGGLAGLAGTVLPGPEGQGADWARKIQEQFTYQPRTEAGQQVLDAAGLIQKPFTAAGEWAQRGTEDSGVAGAGVLGAISRAGIENLPLLVGVGKTLGGKTGAAADLEQAFQRAKAGGERIEPSFAANPGVDVRFPQNTGVDTSAAGLTPEGLAKDGFTPVNPGGRQPFATSAPTATPGQQLPAAEQARRAEVLRSVGLTQARQSALAGDAPTAATEAQMAKVDNPAGTLIKAQLNDEKAALTQHAEGLVEQTGGTQGLDQSTQFTRGNAIVAPLDALKDYFDTQTRALYQAADERAQGVPAPMTATQRFIGGDQAEFLGTQEGESLLKGVQARMRSLGMLDADGNPAPATVQQAEQLKQYLNNQWQPRTARLIRGMKDAIDDDVTQAAGEDIYQQARQMRAQRAATLDNPNGIAKIMDSSGPDGINRAVAVEKIPDAVAGLPAQQFGHIIETLRSVPADIQPQAQAALAEIKAQYANKVQAIGSSQAGQWNARGVSQYLNNNAANMAQVFSPEEMAQFRNLNDAGHILAKDQSYPGAAAQAHNLGRAGILTSLASTAGGALGGTVGGTLFGPVGAAGGGAAGTWAGAKAAGSVSDAMALRAAQKRLVPLREVKP